LEQQKTPQPVVANSLATPDAVNRLSPALADAIIPFLNKFPDACIGLPFAFALMHAFAKANASKRAKPRLSKRDAVILPELFGSVVCFFRCGSRGVGYNGSANGKRRPASGEP
jgi:hypothetical protein